MQDFLLGGMPDEAWKAARGHLAECETCRIGIAPLFLDDLAQTSTVPRARRDGAPVAPLGLDTEAVEAWSLGQYTILRELGHGGQGQVFLAEDTKLGRKVALKVLATAFSRTSHSLHRFQREATSLSKLNHPGLCAVYDAGEIDGIPYIAMQHIEGVTLAKSIAARKASSAGPLSREEVLGAARVVERAARALHAAHEAGLIHRDIKPGNIMLTRDSEPVILDFGLARDEHGGLETLTQSGDIMGTPAYMSPEQLSGPASTLDRRTDVYALGVTLYQCVTLHLPFEASTREALYKQILTETPLDPRPRCPHLSRDLKVILETALEKSLERRYATCLELAEDLRRIREYEPIRARSAGAPLRFWRWMQRNPVLATSTVSIFVMLAVALCISLVLLRRVSFEEGEKSQALAREKAQTQALELALKDKSAALEAKGLALQRAEALRIAARAESVLANNPGLALILALKANDYDPSAFATTTLLKAMADLHQSHALLGHRDLINAIAASPVDDLVATGSADETGRIWNARTGRQTALLWGHTDQIENVQFSSDGRRVVTCSRDHTARIWDSGSGALLRTLTGHTGDVTCAAFSLDGKKMATTSRDSTARIWSCAMGKELLRLEGIHSAEPMISFSLDGHRLCSWGRNRDVFMVWDALDGRLVLARGADAPNNSGISAVSRNAHWGLVSSRSQARQNALEVWTIETGELAALLLPSRVDPWGSRGDCAVFSGDSRFLAHAGLDNHVTVVETGSWKEVSRLSGHALPVRWIELSPDGNRVVTGSDDKTARVWETLSGAPVATFKGHSTFLTSVTFLRSGREVATVGAEGSAYLWSLLPRGGVVEIKGAFEQSHVPSFSADSRKLGVIEGNVGHIHDASSGRRLVSLVGHSSSLRMIRISPDGTHAVTVSSGMSLGLWNAETGQRLWVQQSAPSGFDEAEFALDGKSIFATSLGGVFWRWDLQGRELLKVALEARPGFSLTFSQSPDGERICLCSGLVTQIVRISDGQPVGQIASPQSSIDRPTYSPDGKWIVSTPWAQPPSLWDARTCKLAATLHGHEPGTTVAAFSPDSTKLVTGSTDKTACVWSVPGGNRLLTLRGHTQFVVEVDFTADGSRILTSGHDGLTRIWNSTTGDEVFSVMSGIGPATGARLSPDGRRFLTLERSGLRIWPMDPQAAAEERKPRALAPEDLDLYDIASKEDRRQLRGTRDLTWLLRDWLHWLKSRWPEPLRWPSWCRGTRNR